MHSQGIVDTIINVVFVATFISIFFFTYGAYIEKKIAREQVELAVDDLTYNIKYFAGNQIAPLVNSLSPPNMEEEDKKVAESNSKLIWNVAKLLTLFFVGGMGIAYGVSRYYNTDFVVSIKRNVIILIFIAITEYIFLTFIGAKYRSLDPNVVKKTILQVALA